MTGTENDTPAETESRSVRRFSAAQLALLLILVAGLAAFFAFDFQQYVRFETLRRHQQTLIDFVQDNLIAAVAIYGLIYAAAIAFSVPGGLVLTVTGGFLFGQFGGTAIVVLSATVGATVVFLIAKTALGDPLRTRAGPWLKKMEAGFRRDAFNYLLFLRLVPVFPFFVVNLVPAFLGVPMRTYVVTTLLGIVPGTFVYASVGAAVREIVDTGGKFTVETTLEPEILAALIGLAVLALVPVIYRRAVRRRTEAE